MPLSKDCIDLIRKAQEKAGKEGYELFCFGFTDDFSGELATVAPRDMSRDEVADVADAFSACLRDKETQDISGTCVPPTIN